MRGSRDHQPGQRGGAGAATAAPTIGPGKRTLTEALGAGEPLPDAQRAQFERSLGRDLSSVRVHSDGAAAEHADRADARAFATGQHIVFGRGEHRPDDRGGLHLLAHEVAHTAQQAGAAPAGELATTQPGDGAERNADAAAAAMLAGKPAAVSAQPASIARKAKGETEGETIGEAVVEPASPAGPAAEAGGPGSPAASGGGDATAAAGKGEDAQIGELTAERVGQEVDDGEDVGPDVPVRDPEAGKQGIAAAGQQLPPEGGAEGSAGGVAPDAGGGGAVGAGGGGDGGGVADDVSASVVAAQSDTREAIAESEADAAAYKAEMTARRDGFEAEQHATMLEQLKTMSSIEKRQTLQEMGYDPKAVKKLKDAELDGLIEGRMESEQRKTKILGMTPEELAALSPGQKIQYLVDLGIDRGDLDKAGQAKATQLFDDIMKVAHVPGQHKVKIKIKGGLLGKSWEVTVKCDAEGNTDIEAKKQGGLLSKLWGWVKAALPIILTVLGPLTAGASLVVLAVYQTVTAIKSGDWLGAVIGAAGAVIGAGAFMAAARGAAGAATTFSKIADVATKVKKVAEAAQLAMQAAKAKNAGSLLGALAAGAAVFAAKSSTTADKFAQTMKKWSERLDKWSKVIAGGEKVVQGIKKGDPLAAIGGAFDTAVAAVGKTTGTTKALERASKITGFVNAGKRAMQTDPPNYPAVAEAALGIANQLKEDRRIEDASKIIAQADRLKQAWGKRASDPGALIDAALGLAGAIQTATYDAGHAEAKDGDGKPVPDAERAAITRRYERAGEIVRAANAAVKAATTRPRPSYVGALDAATQLIAALTESKQIDAAAVVTSKLAAWTRAVNAKDERAIFQAGVDLGTAINGLATVITTEQADARREAEANLAPGETLPAHPGDLLPPEASVDASVEPSVDASPPYGNASGPSDGYASGPSDSGGDSYYDPPASGERRRGGPNAEDAEPAPRAPDTRTLSGSDWCAKFPGGTTIAELTDATFKADVQAFHDAMVAAATPANKLSINIDATFRPANRAHLMHYAYNVSTGTTTPADANKASADAGIDINWDHGTLETSKAKAGEMVTTYRIKFAPSLTTRHTEGKAIDWTISWTGSLLIAKKGETDKQDCTGGGVASAKLHEVGESYGVHKHASDPPHWSTDGK